MDYLGISLNVEEGGRQRKRFKRKCGYSRETQKGVLTMEEGGPGAEKWECPLEARVGKETGPPSRDSRKEPSLFTNQFHPSGTCDKHLTYGTVRQ